MINIISLTDTNTNTNTDTGWIMHKLPDQEIFPEGSVLCITGKTPGKDFKSRTLLLVQEFAKGCNGILTTMQQASKSHNPICIRGTGTPGIIRASWSSNRTFYYIDNGYFNPYQKEWMRVIKNHVHDIRPLIIRPRDRMAQFNFNLKPMRTRGQRIILAPPSSKSLSLWGLDFDVWLDQTLKTIKKYTNRPISVRLKRPRFERTANDTIEDYLANDCHCLVTYNSVAAVDALINGVPVFTLGPNAAGILGLSDLSKIETPRIPSMSERLDWLSHLSYSQFTQTEISNGTAWRILNNQ